MGLVRGSSREGLLERRASFEVNAPRSASESWAEFLPSQLARAGHDFLAEAVKGRAGT